MHHVGPFRLPLGGEQEPVLDATASFQHIGVIRRRVPFADDIGATQLEFGWQRRLARPLHVLRVVPRALVRAPHRVDLVEATYLRRRYTLQLRDCADASVAGLRAGAEGEGLYVGEEDGVLGFGCERGRDVEEEGEEGGEDRGWEEHCDVMMSVCR
jgi:hypothetical protein